MAKQPGLRVRKLADKSQGTRVVRYHPETGERHLVNPATNEPEPWPFAGLAIEGNLPKVTSVSTTFVNRGRAEGWLELVGEKVVHREGGPPEDPWRVTHTFVHASALVLKTVDGAVRYRVVHQPDKHDDADEPSGKRVDWFYGLELEG
jgi:hypothetical protein